MRSQRGFTLIELIVYVALFSVVSITVVQLILSTHSAFAFARVRRSVQEQGNAALERIVRELRLATTVDSALSVMDTNPGTLVLNTVISPSDGTPISRKFFVEDGTVMMQNGTAPAIALTSGITVTNLVFRDAGRTQASDLFYYVRGSFAGCSNLNNGLTPLTAFCTISKAATLATAGSAVIVGAGTYNETINLTNSGTFSAPITYLADVGGTLSGDAGAVIIRGGTNGFKFTSTGSTAGIDYTTIEGFTITATTNGILGNHGSDHVTIRNNVIYGNTNGILLTTAWGNGAFVPGADWLIEFNSIYGNDNGIRFNSGEYTDVIVQYNKITSNINGISGTDGGNGGFEPANALTIQHNEITDNTVGILSHPWLDGIFFDNRITENEDEGLLVIYRSYGVAEAITFRNNTVRDNGADGLLFGDGLTKSSLHTNSIIENNNITDNGERGINTSTAQCAIIRNNDVFGNAIANYAGCPNQTGQNGNISANPLYTGPGMDSHLEAIATGHSADSPAIDHGYTAASIMGLDQRSTRIDGIHDSGIADIGYHYGGEAPGIQVVFGGRPASQAIRIELTVQGGAEKYQSTQSSESTIVLRGTYR